MRVETFGAAAAAGLLAFSASAARATTVDFTYLDGATPVATGSFTYATGDTGVLGYADLTSFSVTGDGVTYDLAEADALTDYSWFAYDTATNSFVTNPDACGTGGCGFKESLGALSSFGSDGFFFNPAPGTFTEYSTETSKSFTSIEFSVVPAPEPAAWALMLAGFAGLGAVMRMRRARPAAA